MAVTAHGAQCAYLDYLNNLFVVMEGN